MIQKKICMLGAFATGKTSLVRRLVESIFSEKYLTTVGVRISKKKIEIDGRTITLVLWDIHGEDRFQVVEGSYLRSAAGYLLVADGTRRETVKVALELHERASSLLGPVPALFLLNKRDLGALWELTDEDREYASALGLELLETSAKTGDNVEAAFDRLARRML